MTNINSSFSFIVTGSCSSLFIMESHPNQCISTLSSNFETVLEYDTFVDKSALILAVFETNVQPMVLCTAPRRFGAGSRSKWKGENKGFGRKTTNCSIWQASS